MASDDQAWQLHRRFSRGERLTAEDQSVLDAWYAKHDAEDRIITGEPVSPELVAELRARNEALLTEIQAITQQIQRQQAENESIRREVEDLQRQLAQRRAARAV
jgi:hypothetical protein